MVDTRPSPRKSYYLDLFVEIQDFRRFSELYVKSSPIGRGHSSIIRFAFFVFRGPIRNGLYGDHQSSDETQRSYGARSLFYCFFNSSINLLSKVACYKLLTRFEAFPEAGSCIYSCVARASSKLDILYSFQGRIDWQQLTSNIIINSEQQCRLLAQESPSIT